MSTRLRLIRHGNAGAQDLDPGLTALGVREAFRLPALVPQPPDTLLTSPLVRARETALPLANAFDIERQVIGEYGELPWRQGQNVAERHAELAQTLGRRWSELDADWREWRQRLIARALSERGDIVVVSHFVAINVLVGHAQSDDRTVIVRPANASITEFAITAAGTLELVALGAQIPSSTSTPQFL